MERNAQDASGKIRVMTNKMAVVVIVTILALTVGLGAGYLIFGSRTRLGLSAVPNPNPTPLASSPQRVTPVTVPFGVKPTDIAQSTPEPPVSSSQISKLYQAFVCPCCGQDIGSCNCEMARERRGLIAHLVAQGASQSQVYRAMFQTYGAGAFFDQALAAKVRADLVAALPAERPVLVVEPTERDLGTVPITGGLVSATFTVRNAGQSDLTITGLQTTCACTTAVLETSQGTSPVFGANPAENPADWSAVLAPGEEALLVATFDPMFHGPEATGKFRRMISIASNDPLNSRLDVAFVVEVTK